MRPPTQQRVAAAKAAAAAAAAAAVTTRLTTQMGAEAGAFGDGGEATAAAATAVAAAYDASAAFGGGAAAVVPAATAMATAAWFAQAQMPNQAQMQTPMQTLMQMPTQAQMQMQVQALMQMPVQAQMQMPTQMQTQLLSSWPTQPSVITLLDEIQCLWIEVQEVGTFGWLHSADVSGNFGGAASACSFGPGGGGCDSVPSVGHRVLHGGGLSIATAALGPPSDWLCSSPGGAVSGAQGSGAALGGSSCLSPGGGAAPGSAGGAGGARAGAMLVQQRYRECEQLLGLLEAAVLQLDTRYRCGAALLPHPTTTTTTTTHHTPTHPTVPSPLQPWSNNHVHWLPRSQTSQGVLVNFGGGAG